MLSVDFLSPEWEAEWETFVHNHPEATSYHHLIWRDIFVRTFHYTPYYLVVRRKRDIAGILPLFLVSTFSGRQLVSVPFRDRGGILGNDAEAIQALCHQAQQLACELGCRNLILKHLSPCSEIENQQSDNGFTVSLNWVRSIVTLKDYKDNYWDSINDKTRNMIRQSQRAGLVFTASVSDEVGIVQCLDVFCQTQQRLGIPPFPERFYRILIAHLLATGQGELQAVSLQNQVVACAIVLRCGRSHIYAYAGSLEKFWCYRSNDFLVWNCLNQSIQSGADYFDFGSDSQYQMNLLAFKKKWLTHQTPVHYYFYSPRQSRSAMTSYHDSSQGIYPLLRKIVSRLPRPIYLLSSHVTRYFG